MIRFTLAFIIIIILSGSVLGLFYIKYQVQNLNKDLNELNKQYAEEQESIRVLKAEWSYLNQPERLKELSKKYLKLEKMKLAQIRKFDKEVSFDIARNNVIKTIKHNKFIMQQKENIVLRY
ncbi:MAG: hypothetical protein AB8U25_00825 [Rickettsiales endosymbiont of Dermacentor nuttalli]